MVDLNVLIAIQSYVPICNSIFLRCPKNEESADWCILYKSLKLLICPENKKETQHFFTSFYNLADKKTLIMQISKSHCTVENFTQVYMYKIIGRKIG